VDPLIKDGSESVYIETGAEGVVQGGCWGGLFVHSNGLDQRVPAPLGQAEAFRRFGGRVLSSGALSVFLLPFGRP
jgi:hypothetical protein